MSRDEWFRRTRWSEVDRDEFNARVKRCRGSKAQYLRIQAFHLAEAGNDQASIELLDRLFVDVPDQTQLAAAHLQKAECLARLGQDEPAVEEFRAALQTERAFPNSRTSAWLEFGCFVVERRLTALYEEVEGVLDEFSAHWTLPLPIELYHYFAVRAHLVDAKGLTAEACDFARRALTEAAKEQSGLRYHPKLGLIGDADRRFTRKLKALAAQQTNQA